ncbi:MAG: DNA primase [Fusobacteriaceae bacterium]
MGYRSEDIEKLNHNLKIEEVVGEFVELKKSGANYKGLCPFHPDTSPSFMISPSKNICKCFVCGEGGSPIKFYAQYKNIGFNEAVKELSEKYKIPVRTSNFSKVETEEQKQYYEIMELAQRYYEERIFSNSGREALEYLTNRGITPENIKKYRIGYADNTRTGITDYLLSKGYGTDVLMTLGISKSNENGVFDAFRNRVMFPIFSLEKKVVAFGGRTLEQNKEVPKYINSPDTPIFKKGRILYGLGEKSAIVKKKKYSILMEGYMDVIMADLNGFDVTLAPLGTALTDEQAALLQRYSPNVILSFDMDGPGQRATEKAILTLKKVGCEIRVIMLEGAKDPDEFLKLYGKDSFLKAVKTSEECFDFLYNYYAKEYDLSDLLSKQNFINRFLEFFQSVENGVQKSLYLDKLSKNIGIDRDVLHKSLIDENKVKSRREPVKLEKKYEENENLEEEDKIEILTISLILADNSYYSYFKDSNFKTNFLRKIMSQVEMVVEEGKTISANELIKLEVFDEIEKNKLLDFSLLVYNSYSKKQEREKLFIEILSDWLRKEILELQIRKEYLDIPVEKKMRLLLQLKMISEKLKRVSNLEEILKLYTIFNDEIKSSFFDV